MIKLIYEQKLIIVLNGELSDDLEKYKKD